MARRIDDLTKKAAALEVSSTLTTLCTFSLLSTAFFWVALGLSSISQLSPKMMKP